MVFLDEGIKVWTSEEEGYVFVHMEIKSWTPSEYKRIKQTLSSVGEHYLAKGHELIFATTEDERITKMWNRMKPLYELRVMKENGHWIGAWELE